MNFDGPTRLDFDNVANLNGAFLDILCRDPDRFGFPVELQLCLRNLRSRQLRWLAATPFLLFSLQEDDHVYWQRLLEEENAAMKSADLFRDLSLAETALAELRVAAVSFVWHLASRNPHAVLLVCGGSNAWCHRLSECTSFDLLSRTRHEPMVITARNASNRIFWTKLLTSGVDADSNVRRYAQVAALQTFLASLPSSINQEWQTAACKSDAPFLQVAEARIRRRKQ